MSRAKKKAAEILARQSELVQQAFEQFGRRIAGRVVVITGGARGIGETLARAFLKNGASVVVADRSWGGAEAFRRELEASGHGLPLVMNAIDDAQIDSAYAATLDRFKTVDVLINNAGLVSESLFAPMGRVSTLDTKDSDWEAMFRVNLFGTLKTTRRFIRQMLEQRRGSIINIVSSGVLTASMGGGYYAVRPWTVEMPYQATKAAVMALSFYLAEEIRYQNVAVNSVMPGHTRAAWFEATALAYQERGMPYITRPMIAEHMLPIVLFLAAQDGTGVTGRMYNIPDWNYDHGYGRAETWVDHNLPSDIEAAYARLEAVMPVFERSGMADLSFDALSILFRAGLKNLADSGGKLGS